MNSASVKDLSSYFDKCFKDHGVKIRKAEKSDCQEIARLIQELADFEKMPLENKMTTEVLARDGFEHSPPLFYCLVAEAPNDSHKLIGYALYYFTYSTWRGKVLYLEDLFCSVAHRNLHVGSSLFRAACKEALYTDCQQMDFVVLEWNPARKFYERHGAANLTEKESWLLYRMSKPALEEID